MILTAMILTLVSTVDGDSETSKSGRRAYCVTTGGQAVSVCCHGPYGYSAYLSMERVDYDPDACFWSLAYPTRAGYAIDGLHVDADWRINPVLRALS